MRQASAAATPSAASDGCGTDLSLQQSHQHELHLLFRRRAGSDDGLLDLGRRKLDDLDARLLPGQQHDASRVPEDDRGANVLRVEDVLDRERVWPVTREQLGDAVVDLEQPSRRAVRAPACESRRIRQGRRAQARLPSRHRSRCSPFQDRFRGRSSASAILRHPSTFASSATSMSKFAQTFWTSSRSSIVSISLNSDSASLPAICTVFFGTIASSASRRRFPLP